MRSLIKIRKGVCMRQYILEPSKLAKKTFLYFERSIYYRRLQKVSKACQFHESFVFLI